MAQDSLIWGGTTLGDAPAPDYDPDAHGDFLRDLFMHDRRDSGVLKTNLTGFDGELLASNPAGSTLRVATGVAMVDGTIYYNSANVDNASGSAPGQFERIVLRKGWVAQTVRVAVLGPAGAQPALTQNAGVTWEIPIATVENVGGVLTFTDERVFLPQIGELNLADGAVTTPSIADSAITAAKFVEGALGCELIESQTLGAPAASITFAAISELYSHLMIIMAGRSTGAGVDTITMQFNADVGNNYSYMNAIIDHASAQSTSHATAAASILIASLNDTNCPAGIYSPAIIQINGYSELDVDRCALAYSTYLDSTAGETRQASGNWTGTDAISSIVLNANGGNFAANTIASLYGLR